MTCDPGQFPPPPIPSALVSEIRQMLRMSIEMTEDAAATEKEADKAEAEGRASIVTRRRADAFWAQVKDIDVLIVGRLEQIERLGILEQLQNHLKKAEEARA